MGKLTQIKHNIGSWLNGKNEQNIVIAGLKIVLEEPFNLKGFSYSCVQVAILYSKPTNKWKSQKRLLMMPTA